MAGCGTILVGTTSGVISATGGGGGGGAPPAPVNQPPAASASVAGTTFGDLVVLEVTLVDPEGDRADIDVEFSVSGGAFAPATEAQTFLSEGTRNLAASSTGTPHRFVWNAFSDLGGAEAPSVRLRVTPRKAPQGAAGIAATTGAFAVVAGRVSTIVGGSRLAGVDTASGLAADLAGRLFVLDRNRPSAFRFDSLSGDTDRFVGTGAAGRDPDDFPAGESRLGTPLAIAEDDAAIYIADGDIGGRAGRGRIARVDLSSGFLTTFAGLLEGDTGVPNSPRATENKLSNDLDVAARAGSGLVYVLDRTGSANQAIVFAVNGTSGPIDVPRAGTGGSQVVTLEPGELGPIGLGGGTIADAIAVGDDRMLYVATTSRVQGRFVRAVSCINPTLATITTRKISPTTTTAFVDVPPAGVATIVTFTALAAASGVASSPGTRARIALDDDGTIAILETPDDRGVRARLQLACRGTAPRAVSETGTIAPGVLGTAPVPDRVDAAISIAFAPRGGLVIGSEQGRIVALATSMTAGAVLGIQLQPGASSQVPVFIDPQPGGLSQPSGIALAPDGTLFVCDAALGSPRVAPISSVVAIPAQGGVPALVAGAGSPGFSGDGGPAAAARLAVPLDVAVKPDGDGLLVADWANGRIRRIHDVDGVPTIESVPVPLALVTSIDVDADGTTYAGDGALGRVVRVDFEAGGRHEAVIDGLTVFGTDSGIISPRVRIGAPRVLFVATGGSSTSQVLCANRSEEPVRVAGVTIAPGGQATIIAPGPLGGPLGASPAIDVRGGLLVVVDPDLCLVRAVNLDDAPRTLAGLTLPTGVLVTIAGTGRADFNGDPLPALEAHLDGPAGVAIREDGAIAIVEAGSGVVRLLNAGTGPLLAGGREIGPGEVGIIAGAPGAGERTNEIWGVSIEAGGDLLFTTSRSIFAAFPGGDPGASFVYRGERARRSLTRLVGGASEEALAAPPLRGTRLLLPTEAIRDPARPLVIVADARASVTDPARIRMANIGTQTATAYGIAIDTGAVETLPGLVAAGLALARDGSLYVPDYTQGKVLRVTPDGSVATVLASPDAPVETLGVAVPGFHDVVLFETETTTTLYASESHTGRVYAVTFPGSTPGAPVLTSAPGVVFVGLATNPEGVSFTGHALPRGQCALAAPAGLACDAAGLLYVADRGNSRILVVNGGASDVTVAGTLVPAGFAVKIAGAEDRSVSYNGELVPPRNAHLTLPYALAIDAEGSLFFTEPEAGRLRRFATR